MEFDRKLWQPYLATVFNDLHNIPEPSWQEVKTTEYLKEQLAKWGYQTTTFADCTGVVGQLGQGSLAVGLRADIDALCHQTDEGAELIHSCGHDAHMAMVTTAAAALSKMTLPADCCIKIIFQPAEEKGEGALRIIEKGMLEEVAFLFGVHLRPVQELRGGLASSAIQNGAACLLHGTIKGLAAHGARPHLGINVIEVAAMLVQMLSGLRWNPLQPASVKMTRLQAGHEAANIIPDHAVFTLDVRAQTNGHMKELVDDIKKLIANLATTYSCQIAVNIAAETPAAEVSPEAMNQLARAITDTIGTDNLAPPVLTPGAEDFHYYTRQHKGLKASMLGLGCDLKPGLHHPDMNFERQYLMDGAEILARAVWYACHRQTK